MAKFLTTRGTTSEIENIINNANKGLMLVCPYFKIPSSLFQNLLAADKRGVSTTVIFGKKDLRADVKQQLSQLKNVRVYFLENLHAKCYFNEISMVITSLNLYDFSELNNREMGVLVTVESDKELFNEAIGEARRLISMATPQNLGGRSRERVPVKTSEKVKPTPITTKESLGATLLRGFTEILAEASSRKRGYCIRCGGRIPYNLDYTYCSNCFPDWVKHGGNPNYTERRGHCHTCGKSAAVSRAKPECDSCYWV